MNTNSLKNLKPMNKGTTLNYNGRPKGSKDMTTIMREMLDVRADYNIKSDDGTLKKGKKSYKMLIIDRLMKKASNGDLRAVEILLDRLEGKPTQKIDNINPQIPTINVNLVKPE